MTVLIDGVYLRLVVSPRPKIKAAGAGNDRFSTTAFEMNVNWVVTNPYSSETRMVKGV